MYASMFRIELSGELASHDRRRSGRELAAELARLPGFVAFIALEAEDGAVGGLCVCMDAVTLAEARQLADAWPRERYGSGRAPLPSCVTGKVIVQHGF